MQKRLLNHGLARWFRRFPASLTARVVITTVAATVALSAAEELGPPPIDTGETYPPTPPRLGKMAVSVNPENRAEVVNFFNTVYRASEGVAIGWNGNVANCAADVNSSAYEDATVQRVNFFRAMAGLPGDVTLDEVRNSKCQEAALMMSAEGNLSHSPGTNWHCYTAAGAEAAGKSNLYLGREGPPAIDGYIDDPGSNNYFVGHRRWILYPPQKVMGTGSIPSSAGWSANALWVIGGFGTRPAQPAWVAWPPKGFVPYRLLPASGRWSFSYPGADFAQATVSMQGPASVTITVAAQQNNKGYADNTLVWIPNGLPTSAPSSDTTYTVTLSNVLLSGTPRSFTYNVTIIDPDQVALTARPTNNNTIILAWPASATGYALQRNPSVSNAAGWSNVSGSPQLVGSQYTFPVNLSTNQQYYRLRKP